jgi:SAM-dependent methyltransferase
MNNYLEINKKAWNARTEHHIDSDFYDVEGFKKGKSSLNQFELDLLGDVSGLSILHLQCHFGQDTLSLARMGAKVTGVDLSNEAIHQATKLAEDIGVDARFICCDVYSLNEILEEKFDLVFTSYGTIGWLPDLTKWANVVSSHLKPGGKFIFVEFHPFVWLYDDEFTTLKYDYFNRVPIIETEQGTYTDKNAPIEFEYVSWNHPISDVLTSLLNEKIQLKAFKEFDYSPYNCFSNTIEFEPGKFRINGFGNKLPMVYAIQGLKVD